MTSIRKLLVRMIPGICTITSVVLIWYFVCSFELVSSYILPSPEKCLRSFFLMVKSGEIFVDIGISLSRVGRGFSIAFSLGMISYVIPFSKHYFEYLVQFFKNVPPLSMIPLLILWCGIGETTKTVIIITLTTTSLVGISKTIK